MTHDPALSVPPAPSAPPPRRARGIVPLALVLVALAGFLVVMRRPLLMAAPACTAGRWHGCLDTFNGVVLVLVAAVPPAVLVAGALAWRRRAAGVAGAWRLSVAEVGMVYGTVPLVWLTLMPGGAAGTDAPARVSLVPLRDLVTMGWLGILGNLVIFAALGFFAPVRFAAMASAGRVLALGAGCSVLVETAQYALRLDRVSSVDDVLVNAAGALLAGLLSRPWWRVDGARGGARRSRVTGPGGAG
ncbi:VanZ family protein [Streptomyces sp. NPDC090106]|uniref:VanZ family protein n=1 Tax=Streptomyces sp. NPDC090106 TaxID=3365946 RepID=UPI00380D6842